MILIVAHDLHDPGRDYPKMEKVLKTADSWAHPQGSVWFLDTPASPSDWVDRLRVARDTNDEYFVCRLQKNWSSYRMDQKVVDWTKSPTRRW